MNSESCSPSVRVLLFRFLLRRLNVRILMYLAALFQVYLLWTLFQPWPAHATTTDLLLIGIVFLGICLVLRWDLLGIWLGYLYPGLFFFEAFQSGGWPLIGVFTAVLFIGYFALRLYPRNREITLQFPLKGGVFYTAQGGAFPLTNYHGAVVKAQRYACDFFQLNRWGTRALGIFPSRLDRYAIFGATVCSPGKGVILLSVDGLADLPPGQMDLDNVAGNHVVIRLDGLDVNLLLAHLQNGSVSVKVGDRVSAGQLIGKVGNSGGTSEPHLHIHAQRQVTAGSGSTWAPVPIRFGSRWLVRNSVVVA
jgi:hypothetical protein